MHKADLKDNMVVVLRNDECCMYFKKWDALVDHNGSISFERYTDDLYFYAPYDRDNFDIMKVYELDDIHGFDFSEDDDDMRLIWKRLEEPQETVMTIAEIEEELGVKNLKIVAAK